MRVWIENPFDNLPAEGRRPQRYWLMAEAFARAGHDVTLWTSDFSHATKSPRALRETGQPIALRLVETPPYMKNVSFARIKSHRAYARNWLRDAREEASAHGAPALLVVSLPPLATADAALALKAEFGARLVVDVMDAWPETFYRLLPKGLRALGRLALLPLHRAASRAYSGADLVTGVCDAYEGIARAGGAKDYLRFYHGVAVDGLAPRARKPTPDRLALVYVGNLGRGYDLSTAIRAVKERDGVTLDIAGAGEREAAWRACAGGSPRIRFHGYLGEEALGRLLDASDVGVIPLADDSFVGIPYKLGDYARHGLRMVSSLGGECAALLARHRAGATYRAGDVASFNAALDAAATADADIPSLLGELDASRIYDAYVACVSR